MDHIRVFVSFNQRLVASFERHVSRIVPRSEVVSFIPASVRELSREVPFLIDGPFRDRARQGYEMWWMEIELTDLVTTQRVLRIMMLNAGWHRVAILAHIMPHFIAI